MKRLILVRHGEYDSSNGSLNQSGFYQMELLADKLKEFTKESFIILSSGVKRADESTEILLKKLTGKSEIKKLEVLNYQPDNLTNKRFRKIKRASMGLLKFHETIIFVTHLGVVSDFPGMFAQKNWHQNKKRILVKKGNAVVINLEEKNYEVISYK